MPKLLHGHPLLASALLLISAAIHPALAQDDATTRNGTGGYGGAWITGPASNPLSFLNGPAFRTTGINMPYDFPDFAPLSFAGRATAPLDRLRPGGTSPLGKKW